MSTEHCGITSLLPVSCRGSAEAFARNLQTRLRILGPIDASETSWINKPSNVMSIEENLCGMPRPCEESESSHPCQDINENTINDVLYAKELEVLEIGEITNEIVNNALNVIDFNESRSEEDGEEEELEVPRIRRCSSLKTGKTPPGTPGRKKIVRFADVLGLDLADVRMFLDEIPKVPPSAYKDLRKDEDEIVSKTERTLLALFQQPGEHPNFLDKVRINQAMLENCMMDDPVYLSVMGMIRVRNLDYNKSVYVRYSLDSWKTHSDIQATYVDNSCDGFSDRFSFKLYAYTLSIGQRLEFAIRFQCKGFQFWDNNGGANYCFQMMPQSPLHQQCLPITGLDEKFATFCYMDEAGNEANLCHTAVQDYITNSLQKNNTAVVAANPGKQELFTIIFVIFFSIVFLYVKRAVFF
ncbi:PREDICTED: glycogen-binding subunit 76A isoform X2 [Nicrophorus vespilloides]|nr:PREDICTED: glycogen-binding subunit 76A isoform X2 [Nicrophorus vespilloides]